MGRMGNMKAKQQTQPNLSRRRLTVATLDLPGREVQPALARWRQEGVRVIRLMPACQHWQAVIGTPKRKPTHRRP